MDEGGAVDVGRKTEAVGGGVPVGSGGKVVVGERVPRLEVDEGFESTFSRSLHPTSAPKPRELNTAANN